VVLGSGIMGLIHMETENIYKILMIGCGAPQTTDFIKTSQLSIALNNLLSNR
jgi:hypothetical protein